MFAQGCCLHSRNVIKMANPRPNERSGVDAGTALCLHVRRLWPGATHRERWAERA
jgi:hypothetical protein